MSILKKSFRIKRDVSHIKKLQKELVDSGKECSKKSLEDKSIILGDVSKKEKFNRAINSSDKDNVDLANRPYLKHSKDKLGLVIHKCISPKK